MAGVKAWFRYCSLMYTLNRCDFYCIDTRYIMFITDDSFLLLFQHSDSPCPSIDILNNKCLHYWPTANHVLQCSQQKYNAQIHVLFENVFRLSEAIESFVLFYFIFFRKERRKKKTLHTVYSFCV